MKGKVLIIEDSQRWQDRLRRYLEVDGFYVEAATDLDTALNKIANDRFHFITIDLQLDNNNKSSGKYEGWNILEIVKKIRLQYFTPCMVITAHGEDYEEVRKIKNVDSLFMMEKQILSRLFHLVILKKQKPNY